MLVETFDQLQQRIPKSIIEHAVRGMLPKRRLQKQELASFAVSAENVVRYVEESVRQELLSSLLSSADATAAPPPKPQVERNEVVVSIQNKDGVKQYFCISSVFL